jgi:hypothetical protein
MLFLRDEQRALFFYALVHSLAAISPILFLFHLTDHHFPSIDDYIQMKRHAKSKLQFVRDNE